MRDVIQSLLPYGFDSGATFSECRRWRYRLWRSWGDRERRCVFVGLNPSTADESENDHTIRKDIGFAKRWGFTAIDKVNMFAWASTDMRGLLRTEDPVGPENDQTIREAVADASRVVLCWGSHAPVKTLIAARADALVKLIVHNTRAEVGVLGRCADGSPRHTLMPAYSTPFERV